MSRVLIVANQTACGKRLFDEVKHRADGGRRSFTLLVPATRPHRSFTWTDGEAKALATRRMDAAMAKLATLDIDIDGQIGVAPSPFDTVMDALRDGDYDEVIVSTLPHAVSHWLKVDLPARIEKHSGLPVTHVVGEAAEWHAA